MSWGARPLLVDSNYKGRMNEIRVQSVMSVNFQPKRNTSECRLGTDIDQDSVPESTVDMLSSCSVSWYTPKGLPPCVKYTLHDSGARSSLVPERDMGRTWVDPGGLARKDT